MTTVEKIKAKILDLAIRGKLVPQDPNDEPASELLKRIRAEKEELVKAKKIKKEKNPSEIVIGSDGRPYEKFADGKTVCIEDEIPFDLPNGWAWARIGDVFDLQAGKNIKADCIYEQASPGHPFACFGGNGIRGYVGSSNVQGIHAIIGRQGALCGNLNLSTEKFYATEHAVVVTTFANTEALFAFHFLKAMNLNRLATATAQPGLSVAIVNQSLMPIPPLAEQKRIVAKIKELFAETDKIAVAEDSLAYTAERINKKVLDLAMRGQLVPQDPNDEPAEELLNRIAEARQRNANKKSRRSKCEESVIFYGADRSAYETRNGKTVCIDDEIPFDIPDSWVWCRLRDLGEFVGGHTPSLADKSNWENGSILWVTSKDMKQKYISDTGNKISRKGAKELQLLPPGSLLMVTRSGILRRTFPIAIAAKPLTINQDQRALRFHLQGIEEYVYCVLKGMEALILRDYRKTGTTVESIIWEKFIDLLIPIPSLAEQKRIVAKIEYIMSLTELIART